ncbi:hypothetical protein HG536_0F01680 [Torulaspora globosa]|uniref:RBR-type E3 ubiquitin transferase n=1 Tax=Torulaspora globosa TaxID=48254 RepID=A0A7G3ZK07_9SACH|nr:uncharacterized protein HG536_0F01680 [Torulaspora globosa]QLL33843.1 hypothetical protein HG536_0F01680 [Torulaspora globosa]
MDLLDSEDNCSLLCDDDYDDDDSIDLYESQTTATGSMGDNVCHKLNSLVSDDSGFEIDEELLNEDVEDDLLSHHMKSNDRAPEGNTSSLKYECLTMQDIFDRMLERVHHLQPIFSMPAEDILLLMQRYDWNEERLLEEWTEKMDKLLIEAGLSADDLGSGAGGNVRGIKRKAKFECFICCEDKPTETFALECGHEYCIECYRRYISDRLNQGKVITCMDCPLALKNEDIDAVMGTASSARLMNSSIKSFIQKHNRNYKWCPYADCKCIIHLNDTTYLQECTRLHRSWFVTCKLSHSFCFGCGYEIHAPADCNVANAWVKKARKESENLNWVLSHTKECPKCSVNIEKNGGCNHMVCSSCKYEFCWICGGDWAPHGRSFFQCTMYKNDDEKQKTSVENSKRTLKRYTFYYRVFNEHEVSAKLDWKLGQTVGQKVKVLQEKMGVSWIEGQFLADSLKILNEGRTVLKWSFAAAYYSDASHNLTKIFVDNQILLSNAVEHLSELLQIKDQEAIMKRKPEFYNKSGYVQNRTRALIECGRDLLRKGICKPAD